MDQKLAPTTSGEPDPVNITGLCLLSLDGSGVRGLSTLYILKGIMQRLNYERQTTGLPAVKPCEVFDLIGGISTGGLIAIMLGRLEMTVEACIAAYENLIRTFDSAKLRKAVGKVISDNGGSTEDLLNNGRDRGCRVYSSDNLRGRTATSAATGFFDTATIGPREFVDGALGANNPVEEVEAEAANIWWPDSRELMPLIKCFVSIGTGNPGKKALEDKMLKFLSKTLVDMVTETEKTEEKFIARWGLQNVGLAEYKEQGVIQSVTDEYLRHAQQKARVRDCFLNLRDKQNHTDTAFEAVVNEYSASMAQLQSNLQKAFCNIPFPRNPRFVGRDEQLDTLEEKLCGNTKVTRMAIFGLGGAGKTQIALELAYRIGEKITDCSVLWIPAMSIDGMEQAYADILQQLQIPGWDDKQADRKALLHRHLSQSTAGRWLLIFDNVDDTAMWADKGGQQHVLIEHLPRSDKGSIVFTTRDRKTAVKLAQQNVVQVAEFGKEIGLQLLRGYLIQKELVDNYQDAKRLLDELTFLPLAVVQAAMYINENGIDLADYLAFLQEQEQNVVELLSEDFEDEGRYGNGRNPVAITWLISFEKMQSRDSLAADYLSFMACVEPADIPQSLLPLGQSRKRETDAIGLLEAYSFIKRRTKRTLEVHRLVHLAMRIWLSKESNLARWEAKAIRRLKEVLPNGDHANRSIWRLYLPHVRRVLEYNIDGEKVETRTALLWKFAMCLNSDGKYNEAEESILQVVKTRKRVLGPEHQDTLASIHNLASTYWNQGRWKEAEELQVQVVETSKRVLGPEHPSTLVSINQLASMYQNQGR